jgi:hypothetical protein
MKLRASGLPCVLHLREKDIDFAPVFAKCGLPPTRARESCFFYSTSKRACVRCNPWSTRNSYKCLTDQCVLPAIAARNAARLPAFFACAGLSTFATLEKNGVVE